MSYVIMRSAELKCPPSAHVQFSYDRLLVHCNSVEDGYFPSKHDNTLMVHGQSS